MHAIQVSEHGGPEVLRCVEVADPRIGPGQLLVETQGVGVNYIDIYFRTGQYPQQTPYIPGSEGTGVVAAVGAEVTEFVVGDRVAWAAAPGSYADKVAVDEAAAVKVPDGVEPTVAAAALLQGMTAHYLVESVFRPESGDPVLIHAGAGGVGLLLTQMAVAKGARVIATVSTDAKEKLSREAGASEVLRYGDDLAARVRDLTDGVGVAAVYDGVGASTFEASLASLRVRGTLALFGAASGPVPPFDPQRLNPAGSLWLTRPSLGAYTRDRTEFLWRATDVFNGIATGTLNFRIGATYPLAEAAQAHTDLAGRKTTGSIVLLP